MSKSNLERSFQTFLQSWRFFIRRADMFAFYCFLGKDNPFSVSQADLLKEKIARFIAANPDPLNRKVFIDISQKNDAVSRSPLKPSYSKGFKPHFLQRKS